MSAGYTIVAAGEVPDPMPDGPGERRFFTYALGSEQVALTYVVVAAGKYLGPTGEQFVHSHKSQEEIYFVVSGRATFELGDDEQEVGPKTAVLVQPATHRAIRNDGDTDAELVICSVRVEDLRAEAQVEQSS